MGTERQVLSNEKGQSLVEYIMLLAVVASLVSFVFKTDFWQSYFGPEGKFEKAFRARMEYSYRHGMEGESFYSPPNYNSRNHDHYYNGAATRFYRPNEPYPAN